MMTSSNKICLLSVLLSFGLTYVFGASCNFLAIWGPLEADVCNEFYSSGTSVSLELTCDADSNTGTLNYYLGNSCSGNSYLNQSYDFDSLSYSGTCTSTSTDCDTTDAYISSYSSTDCSSGQYFCGTLSVLTESECIDGTSFSWQYSVSDDGAVYSLYTNDDCNGTAFSTTTAFEDGCDGAGNYYEFDDVTSDAECDIGSNSLSGNTKHFIAVLLFLVVFLFVQ